jgi:hypothetical protein
MFHPGIYEELETAVSAVQTREEFAPLLRHGKVTRHSTERALHSNKHGHTHNGRGHVVTHAHILRRKATPKQKISYSQQFLQKLGEKY